MRDFLTSCRDGAASLGRAAKRTAQAVVVGGGVALAGGQAAAQGYTPPTFSGVTMPVDQTSLTDGIVLAGAGIVVSILTYWVGFKLIKKLASKLVRAV